MKLDVFMKYEQEAIEKGYAAPHDMYRVFLTMSLLDLNNMLAQFRSKMLHGEFDVSLYRELFTATDEIFTLFEPKISEKDLSEKERKAFELFRKIKYLEVNPQKIDDKVKANVLVTVAEALVKFAVRRGLLDVMQLERVTSLGEGGGNEQVL